MPTLTISHEKWLISNFWGKISENSLIELATLRVPDWNRNWSLKIWSIFEARRWHSCCQHILSWRESNILTSLLPKDSHKTSTTRQKPSFQFLVPKNWSELSIIPFTGIVSILLVWKHEWVEKYHDCQFVNFVWS